MIETLTRSKNVLRVLTAATGTAVTPVYAPDPYWDGFEVGVYFGLIKTLAARVFLPTLTVTEAPSMPELPTATEKYTIARDATWASPRIHLQLMLKTPEVDWQPLITISLQNPSGLPSHSINILQYLTDGLAYCLSQGCSLGVKLQDAGWGLIPGSDRVVIDAEIHEEALTPPDTFIACTPRTWSLTGTSQILTPANPSRRRLTLVNAGETPVYAARGPAAYPDRGLLILPGGVLDLDAAYLGAVSAIAPTGSGTLVGEECE